MNIRLEFIQPAAIPVSMWSVIFDPRMSRHPAQLERKKVLLGNKHEILGEICNISSRTSRNNEIEVLGNTTHLHHFGNGSSAPRITIHGSIGRWAGANMLGGNIFVHGDAGDGLGAGMSGGMIRVEGNVSDGCGALSPGDTHRMSGGMIAVNGNAGDYPGEGMRRGLIVIAGRSGKFTGAGMIAGTILIGTGAGVCAGINMRRGSIVTRNIVSLLAGFKPAGRSEIGWLRILIRQLTLEKISLAGWDGNCNLYRYTGDHLALGKGELILYEPAE
jgi:formylmethanofuran dehydrogenase subunit C